MKIDPVYLKSGEICKLPRIAEGREGIIYRAKPGVLFKIYHNYIDHVYVYTPPVYDEEGVNIASYKTKGKIIYQPNLLRYMNAEGMRLSREEALYKAIERQKFIHLTFLPQNIIYVDGRIKGCVLREYAHAVKIYKMESLPLSMRLKILQDLLLKVRELVDHNIYHVDLAQRPTKEYPNTNVLLQFPLIPQIVDLDGHSTIYTEYFSDTALKETEKNVALLFMELLTRMNLEEYLNQMDVSELSPLFLEKTMIEEIFLASKKQIFPEMIEDFLHQKLTLEQMDWYLQKLSKKKNYGRVR